MRCAELSLQTQRQFPANARSQGEGWLVRAGYLNHSGEWLPLGQKTLERLSALDLTPAELTRRLLLPTLNGEDNLYAALPYGGLGLLTCPGCGYSAEAELARARKVFPAPQAALPPKLVETPHCSTIDSLSAFLGLPASQTAKALMFSSERHGFVFVVVRGDTSLSQRKLEAITGPLRLASQAEIRAAGAVPGYASPVGLSSLLIVADDLAARSPNLAAGANREGFHLLNVNCGRDFSPNLTADLTQTNPGDPCAECGAPLQALRGESLLTKTGWNAAALLRALAEIHHDERGLTLPLTAFDVYLMQVPGKTLDTRAAAESVYARLKAAGKRVLFDDREERAGVKFNDADLVGFPWRITIGERGLQAGQMEVKARAAAESQLFSLNDLSFLD